MLIPTLICVSEKRVRFEEPPTDTQPQQTTQPAPKQKVNACMQPQWCDVRRDYKGRKIIVAHKGPCYGNGPNGNGEGKGGTEDVKKDSNGNGGAKDGEKKDEAKAKNNGNGGGKNGGGGGGDEKVMFILLNQYHLQLTITYRNRTSSRPRRTRSSKR